MPRIRRAMSYYGEVGQGQAHVAYNHMFLADALLSTGQLAEAREAIDVAVDALDRWEEQFYAPEIWRIRADLLTADPSASTAELAAALRRARGAGGAAGLPAAAGAGRGPARMAGGLPTVRCGLTDWAGTGPGCPVAWRRWGGQAGCLPSPVAVRR